MSKKLDEMSKKELITFILNHLPDIGIDDNFSCCGCGEETDDKYYYFCDRCAED